MITKSKIALIVIAATFTYIVFNLSNWKEENLLHWDETGYYIYLPAAFIYHDLQKLSFYPQIEGTYYLNAGSHWYNIYNEPNGNKLDKYTTGTSLFEMPFFLLAHWYCCNDPKRHPPADGYSEPYLVAVVFSVVFWVVAGLFVLRKFLLRYFSEGATAVTLLLLAFGTNLYFYTVFDIGMSHPFSFALFCFLLSATERWYSNERKINVILIGFILGLIVITRPVNVFVVIIPLCWKYKEGKLSDKFTFFKKQFSAILFSALTFLLIVMIQCSYTKLVTGNWIHDSYEEEHFNFLSPEIWSGLFSYRKGWFLYTPVALFGVIGLIPLAMKYRRLSAIILLYLAIFVYVVFSWCDWSYGGGFGCRPLIEVIAIVSIPLAMFFEWIFAQKKIFIKIIVLTVFSLLITLNTFQSYQLINNRIVWDSMNKAFYWRSFGKLNVTEEDKKLLERR